MMPNDLPPWFRVYWQTQCWIKAVLFEAIVYDLRVLLRLKSNPVPRFLIVHVAIPATEWQTGRL